LKEDFKKVNKGKFFSWEKDNDVKVKCIRSTEKRLGAAVKTKLLKTCGVASVVPTAMMKKGFAESPIKKGYVKAVTVFFVPISARGSYHEYFVFSSENHFLT
jgi:hypothetical protein